MTILAQRFQQARFALFKFLYLFFDIFQALILYGLGFRAEPCAFYQQHAIGKAADLGHAKTGGDEPLDLAHLNDGLLIKLAVAVAGANGRQ